MSYDNIPEEMRARKQWICWREEVRVDAEGQKKTTKVPVNARSKSGKMAKTNDPATWSSFAKAVERAELYDGIGFVFTKDDPYVGIDLDEDFDVDSANVLDVIEAFDTYTERSPSGAGFHLIGRGELPTEDTGRHPKGVGAFHHTRFFTMTGDIFYDRVTIEDCQEQIDRWWPVFFPPEPKLVSLPDGGWRPEDDDVLRCARGAANGNAFIALYDHGETGAYNHNESEADLGLLSMLSFWTQDPDQLDRLFRGSAHYRDKDAPHFRKWERDDYRRDTIAKSLQRSDFYTPPTNSASGSQVYVGGKPISGESASVLVENREVDPETGEILPNIRIFNTTDKGNARRLVHHAGDRLRYVPKWGMWLVWDGRRWAPDELGSAWEVAKAVAETIYDEAAAIPSEDKAKKMAAWAVQSESASRLRDMLRLAQSDPKISLSPIDLDRDPMLLNVHNGTIDLRTGALRPHDRSDLLTKLAAVRFDADATCPRWESFLSEIMARRDSLVEYLQRAAGYTLSGDVSERKMFICHGGGRNGKSTFLNTIFDLLGDYAKRSPNDLMIARHGDRGIPNDVAQLVGVRFTFVSETGEFDRLDENKVKDLVSGDTLSARFLHQNLFDMKPQFKLWAGTNHKPMIRSVDDAIWERTNLIPFTVKIPDDQIDRSLAAKLDDERSGILNWLIEGCLAWQMRGLEAPEIVRQETADYRNSMDVVGSFISEECIVRAQASESVSEMYLAYKGWAEASGERPMTKKSFSMRMAERGHGSRRTGRMNVHMYQDIRLRTTVDGDPSFMDELDDVFQPED